MRIQVLLLGFCAAALVACGSGNVRHPDKTSRPDLTGKSVLIVAEDNASGDAAAAKAFAAAVSQKVGSIKILPSVPAQAVGISKTYAEFGLKNQGAVEPTNPKAIALDELLKLAASLGKFDTIVFVSAEKAGGMAIPKTIKIDLYGSVYDIGAKKVTFAVSDNTTIADTGVVAQMPLKARDISTALLEGYPEK